MMDEDKQIAELQKQLQEIEKKQKIIKLRKELEKLQQGKTPRQNQDNSPSFTNIFGGGIPYKPIVENLQEGLSEFRGSMEGMPHLIIGKKDSDKPNNQQSNVFNEKEQKTIQNIKKWVLVAGVLIVVGYGLYRILKGWLF